MTDEGIEQVETDSWNNEQVHGGNVRRVVTQEGSPSLAGRRPSFDHVLGEARLRDFKPELEQFAADAWRAPKRIFDAHRGDVLGAGRCKGVTASRTHWLPPSADGRSISNWVRCTPERTPSRSSPRRQHSRTMNPVGKVRIERT